MSGKSIIMTSVLCFRVYILFFSLCFGVMHKGLCKTATCHLKMAANYYQTLNLFRDTVNYPNFIQVDLLYTDYRKHFLYFSFWFYSLSASVMNLTCVFVYNCLQPSCFCSLFAAKSKMDTVCFNKSISTGSVVCI